MRVYLPMKQSELGSFVKSTNFNAPVLIGPTLKLAEEYGVAELEEIEYAALEKARVKSENERLHIITAYELPDSLLSQAAELEAGILVGSFELDWQELVAIYRITSSDEELEWYDVSEVATVLEMAGD